MPAYHPPAHTVGERQRGNRIQAAGVGIQTFIDVKVERDAGFGGRAKHLFQAGLHLRLTVDKGPHDRAGGGQAARDAGGNTVACQHVDRRQSHRLQFNPAGPLPSRILEYRQRQGLGHVEPVEMGAQGAGAVTPGLTQGAPHARGHLQGGPTGTVQRHALDGGEQVAIDRTGFADHIAFVDMGMDVGEAWQQEAAARVKRHAVRGPCKRTGRADLCNLTLADKYVGKAAIGRANLARVADRQHQRSPFISDSCHLPSARRATQLNRK